MIASFIPITSLLGLGMPGGWEWVILLVLGLLIFGKRLPEVGRSLGRGIVEFKKGIKGVEDEIEQESSRRPEAPVVEVDRVAGRVSPASRQELPRTSPPAEPRVSRGSPDASARASADDPEHVQAGADSDRDAG